MTEIPEANYRFRYTVYYHADGRLHDPTHADADFFAIDDNAAMDFVKRKLMEMKEQQNKDRKQSGGMDYIECFPKFLAAIADNKGQKTLGRMVQTVWR